MIVRKYNYRCKDYSLLTPYLRDYLVQPLMRWVPTSIPANIITIISNSFVYLGLFLAIYFGSEFQWNFILIPFLVLLYLIGDHMDGMQAKRTKTSSALGEYCDHFLDAFNNGVLFIILVYLFQIDNNPLIIYLIITSYFAHSGVFYTQYKTGWLVFEKLGSMEAVLLTIVMILAAAYPPIYDFYLQDFYGFSIIELVLFISSLGSLATFVRTLMESKGISLKFSVFILVLIYVGVLLLFVENISIVYVFLVLYCSNYIGAIMHGHLVDGKERFPEILSVIVLTLLIFTPLSMEYEIYISAFLLLRTIYLIIRTFYPLRQYWVWVNPKIILEK